MKSKREKERYKHLNAEFQRIARRDKKAFLRDHCKEKKNYTGIERGRCIYKDRFYMTLNGSLDPWVTGDWEININMLRHKASGMVASIVMGIVFN